MSRRLSEDAICKLAKDHNSRKTELAIFEEIIVGESNDWKNTD